MLRLCSMLWILFLYLRKCKSFFSCCRNWFHITRVCFSPYSLLNSHLLVQFSGSSTLVPLWTLVVMGWVRWPKTGFFPFVTWCPCKLAHSKMYCLPCFLVVSLYLGGGGHGGKEYQRLAGQCDLVAQGDPRNCTPYNT